MLKVIASGMLIAAASMAAPAGGNAMPLGRAAISADSGVVLVRDGCGPGYRFSNRRGGCVPMDYEPVDPGAAAVGTAIGIIDALTGPGYGPSRGHYGPGPGSGHRGGPHSGMGYNKGGPSPGGFNKGGPGGGMPKGGMGKQTPQKGPQGGFAGTPQQWKKPGTGLQ